MNQQTPSRGSETEESDMAKTPFLDLEQQIPGKKNLESASEVTQTNGTIWDGKDNANPANISKVTSDFKPFEEILKSF